MFMMLRHSRHIYICTFEHRASKTVLCECNHMLPPRIDNFMTIRWVNCSARKIRSPLVLDIWPNTLSSLCWATVLPRYAFTALHCNTSSVLTSTSCAEASLSCACLERAPHHPSLWVGSLLHTLCSSLGHIRAGRRPRLLSRVLP